MPNIIIQFVSAQNVSLAHLLFEARIHSHDLGGKAYCVTDPGPPFRYGDLYRFLNVLAHPATQVKFPTIPAMAVIPLSFAVELYHTVQRRYLSSVLPPLKGDMLMLQPAMFNYATLHVIYDDARARKDLSYNPGANTPQGLCLHLREWNEKVEADIAAGKPLPRVRRDAQDATLVEKSAPVAPQGVTS
jgi:hypothetical protein